MTGVLHIQILSGTVGRCNYDPVMADGNSDKIHKRLASGSVTPRSASHQERKGTKKDRKAAAQARAAENMRMVAAAQAAGAVPTVVTRESLGVRNPQRARARALAAKVAATKSPKTPASNRPSRPQHKPAPPLPAVAVEPAPHQDPSEASTLFDLIAERGLRLRDRPDTAVPAADDVIDEILHCPVKFAVEIAAGPSIDRMTKCVRPPFDNLWLEYPYLEMVCGAMITSTDNDGERYRINFVTSSRVGDKAPLWWPGPELVELTPGGSLAHRKPAISDSRNSIEQDQIPALAGAFKAVYTHLALIHEVRRRGLLPVRTDTTTPLLPARSHALDGAVVLIWGDAPVGSRSSVNGPRHAPVGHQVRGHQRRLRDGDTTWIRPHRRGAGASGAEMPRTYQVKRRGNGRDDPR